MFVPPRELSFDLAELIEQTIGEWSEIKGSGLIQPETESYGDFIAAELTTRNLRCSDPQSDEALFQVDVTAAQFKEAIIAALDRWLMETDIRPRTPEDIENYNRPAGE